METHIAPAKTTEIKTKICTKCKKSLPATEDFFYRKKRGDKIDLNAWCKPCFSKDRQIYEKTDYRKKWRSEYMKEYSQTKKAVETRRTWQKNNRGKLKNSQLKCKYGITLKEWEATERRQKHRCLICGKHSSETRLVTDHDHKTGKFRGLICFTCNTSLGWFERYGNEMLNYLGEKKS